MKKIFWCDGAKIRATQKGTEYCIFYVRELDENGEPSLEQAQYTAFTANVVEQVRKLTFPCEIAFDMRIRDAIIDGIEEV